MTKYSAIVFNSNGPYELSKYYALSKDSEGYSRWESMYQQSKNEYIDLDDNYKAIVKKYDFGLSDGAYNLLKQLSNDNKIISDDSICLLDSYSYLYSNKIIYYHFKINEDGFIDFESCYSVELIKK